MRDHPFVFISYEKRDAARAFALRDYLCKHGVRAFLFEVSLKPGETIDSAIAEAQRRACATILIWTPHSLASNYIIEIELPRAMALEQLIQLHADGTIPEDLLAADAARIGELRATHLRAAGKKWAADLDKTMEHPQQLLSRIRELHNRQPRFERRDLLRAATAASLLVGVGSLGVGRAWWLNDMANAQASRDALAREIRVADTFGLMLGLNKNWIEVVYGSEYINYPVGNTLLGKRMPSKRSHETARELVDFAKSLSQARLLSPKMFHEAFKIWEGQSNHLYDNSLLVDERPKVFWSTNQMPETLVVISASKTNPATRHMTGYFTNSEFNNEFISLDGLWKANLVVNQFMQPVSRVVEDPVFGRWARYDAVLRVRGHEILEADSDFWMAKLVYRDRTGREQTVVIISAVHGPGLAVARSLFNRSLTLPVQAFIEELWTATRGMESWQIWAGGRQVRHGSHEYAASGIELKGAWRIDTWKASLV